MCVCSPSLNSAQVRKVQLSRIQFWTHPSAAHCDITKGSNAFAIALSGPCHLQPGVTLPFKVSLLLVFFCLVWSLTDKLWWWWGWGGVFYATLTFDCLHVCTFGDWDPPSAVSLRTGSRVLSVCAGVFLTARWHTCVLMSRVTQPHVSQATATRRTVASSLVLLKGGGNSRCAVAWKQLWVVNTLQRQFVDVGKYKLWPRWSARVCSGKTPR